MRPRRLLLFTGAAATLAQSLQDVLTAQSAVLSTLNAWLASQSLVFQILTNVQGVTLLAPSNNALSQLYSTPLATQLASDPNLLTAFLSYHVLDGVYMMSDFTNAPVASMPTFLNMAGYSNVSGGQVVESRAQNGAVTFLTGNNAQSNVQTYDFNFVGGTLHIIDTVLTIPGSLTDTLIAGGLTAAVGALRRAGVETPLNTASDVTVFVPSNDAFNAIGSLVNGMTLEQLTAVLNYHVVQGKVLYSQLIAAGTQLTAEGASLNFRIQNGGLFVNSARVVASDILVGNGVVHVVDGVLNPANTTATPNPSAATQEPAFNGASSATGGVPFTSAVISTTTVASPAGPTATPTASAGPGSPAPVAVDAASGRKAAVGAAMLLCGAVVLANW
ncbi:FAS1 domain-containing protein [Parachaetomium inaequale]|uniref:FAS1 domain-containing protein n=1 Tax=Parachaetomium inaequale TaxID=2588326 RepID=A0AAN6P5G1_9PEZI|nr:FAS1 domain-containing protein [Parachaetomium inaequale]